MPKSLTWKNIFQYSFRGRYMWIHWRNDNQTVWLPTDYIHWLSLEKFSIILQEYKSRRVVTLLLGAAGLLCILIY